MKRIRPAALAEIIFDLGYLSFAYGAGALLLCRAQGRVDVVLYGLLTLILAGGDSFHLLPRIRAQASGDPARFIRSLGIGKLVTSITMTFFYLILYFIWVERYHRHSPLLTGVALLLAAVRMILCLFPQNGWTEKHPSMRWAIYRNLPFCLLGMMIALLFATSGVAQPDGFSNLWLAVVLSFLCYLPVVFLAPRYPKIGMLMLPKTCAYIWIIFMGFSLV